MLWTTENFQTSNAEVGNEVALYHHRSARNDRREDGIHSLPRYCTVTVTVPAFVMAVGLHSNPGNLLFDLIYCT
jgi:hypothetical protein